ncbi:MAG: hypothetical protein JOZ81_01960 [Chloroflexi bacterium]|nr:hypothetical protein [Chloroflexota bacterium]
MIFHVIALVFRLGIDLVVLVLSLAIWLLDHACRLLEAASARLRPTPVTQLAEAPAAPQPVPLSSARAKRLASSIVTRTLETPHDPTQLDLLAAKLWGGKGRPDQATYELAEAILSKSQEGGTVAHSS